MRNYLPLLLPHLFKGVGDVERADLFVVLELEEFVSTVSSHVYEDIGAVVREQSFGTRYRRVDSSCIERWSGENALNIDIPVSSRIKFSTVTS